MNAHLIERLRLAGRFVEELRIQGTWAFKIGDSGQECLYASCFAAMSLDYLGMLSKYSASDRAEWAAYWNSFQDETTGLFVAPEITDGALGSPVHDREHLLMHCCAHVLPALAMLGATPRHPLRFMEPFLDRHELDKWLDARDWRLAWLEGNNLLFVGQFLLWLAARGERPTAERANLSLSRLLDWLDAEIDPRTGMWGTDRGCNHFEAMYGAYHQLLLYFWLNRRPPHSDQLTDAVLALQHTDGGFAQYRGGGTCQDVDGISILANLYARYDYKRADIRHSLALALPAVLSRQTKGGGFFDKADRAFEYMGMKRTLLHVGEPNLFSTWFGIHSTGLILAVVDPRNRLLGPERGVRFNEALSMGWHDRELHEGLPQPGWSERLRVACESTAKRGFVASYARAFPRGWRHALRLRSAPGS